MESRLIKRYNAYYHGWCLAFGEHDVSFEEGKEINWLLGEERIGLVLAPRLRRRLFHELLGHHDRVPELVVADDSVRINKFVHYLADESAQEGMRLFKKFLLGDREFHLFLSSHFCYPPGTRIVTFAKKKPLIIMYKEMQPLQVRIE